MVRVVANIISKVISNNMRTGRGSYSERILDHYENPRNVGSFLEKGCRSRYSRGTGVWG